MEAHSQERSADLCVKFFELEAQIQTLRREQRALRKEMKNSEEANTVSPVKGVAKMQGKQQKRKQK